jgi:subtilisin-like proprotein convertase family protein
MKQRTLIGIIAVGLAWSSMADTFNFNSAFPNSGVIPDGNTAGWSDTRTITGVAGTITDVNVTLNLSGGYNGDLYGYLVHDSGFAVLLNRSGRTGTSAFGYSDAGFNITLDGEATGSFATYDIHDYRNVGNTPVFSGGQLTGTWLEDGRNQDPATVNGTESRDSLLSDFDGLLANGEWTLFLADLAVGGQTTVISWGLEITVIPEPSTWALLALGLLGMAGLKRCRGRAN